MHNIDLALNKCADKSVTKVSIEKLIELIKLTKPDEMSSERIWNPEAIELSLMQYAKLMNKSEAYLFVDRERGLEKSRRENQGILDGGEVSKVPTNEPALFMLRTKSNAKGCVAWWPQIRFPDGNYAFAFAL